MQRPTEQPLVHPGPSRSLTARAAGDTIGKTMRVDRSASAPKGQLIRDERGAVFVEYVTVLCLVTLIGAAAVAALGIPLLHLFRYVQAVIVLPVP